MCRVATRQANGLTYKLKACLPNPAMDVELKNDFPPVSYDQWRALAEADLRGASFEQKLVAHTYEGIDIHPLYTRRDQLGPGDYYAFPGTPPFVRGAIRQDVRPSGWDLRQEYADADPAIANRAILDDLDGGVDSLAIRFDLAARNGFDPDDSAAATFAGRDGIMAYSVDDLDQLLSGVELAAVPVSLEPGAAFLPAAAAMIALWRRRGVSSERFAGALNADPLGVLARDGRLPYSLSAAKAMLADLAIWSERNLNLWTVSVDTDVYHCAGATAAQDVAFSIATGVEYLRGMTAAGLDVDAASRQLLFSFSLGTHHFLAISKLRAARRLWSRVVEASGGSPESGAMRIHARTSQRVLTRRDPYVNLLRNTVGVFAAGLGGAESITSAPLDALLGSPDAFSRRIARNTLLILQEEAHLNRVIDPAGGSWFLDRLTEQISDKGWAVFQEIERQGGMAAVLQSGWIAGQIESAFAPRAKNIARRKEGITGVSEFPDAREERVTRSAPDLAALRSAAANRMAQRQHSPLLKAISTSVDRMTAAVAAATEGATIGQLAAAFGFLRESIEIVPLELRSFAEPFEELRDASDAWQATHRRRPTVFLATMGPVSHFTARATYARNFFEAGGFEVVAGDGFQDAEAAANAFAKSGARIAVICSSDKLYPELVPQTAAKLKAAGARSVVLAGNPGANEQVWRTAGVDRFIFIKCDVLATLREMLREEGVLGNDAVLTPKDE
jgi:methylmalonyl-CoA mutase